MSSHIIWNTKIVNETIQKLRQGSYVDLGCFYEKNPELKAPNILFQLSHEEEEEFIKCSSDIVHFVQTYCKFLTDKGRTIVNLREFQKDILATIGEEFWLNDIDDVAPKVRNLILMSSRQSGKCFFIGSELNIKDTSTNSLNKLTIEQLYDITNKQIKKNFKQQCLYNIKKILYKIYNKLLFMILIKNILKSIILFLIELIEKQEYKKLNLNEHNISKKIIESIPLENLEIETDDGFKPITFIHKTQPYTIWRIELENGMYLECADNHIVFDSTFSKVFIKHLRINNVIQTKEGPKKVIKIKKYPYKVSMFDITVNSKEHRFYSNGILSHNTTTIAAYFAWYLCFHTSRNLLILANKEKTTFEIVDKVLHVFKGLPFFLKPGILSYGMSGMRLDNDCMLTSQATTKTAAIGFSIHVLYMDEFAHIQQNIAREFWRSVYPTLSSSVISQCIISSTPYGQDNLFFEIWDKSIKGQNSFVNKRVDYWEIPEHDDKWAEQMKRDFGEDEFAQEFELKFDIKTNSLLQGSDLSFMKRLTQIFKYNNVELNKTDIDSELYEKLQWRHDFDPNKDIDLKNERYVISIDIAEGKEIDEKKDNDYNVASISKVKLKSLSKLKKLRKDQYNIENLFRIEQIGLYRDNINDETILAKVAKCIVFDQLHEDVVKLVVEMNFNGKSFLKEFSSHDKFHEEIVMHTYHTAPVLGEKPPRKKSGFKTSSDKGYFCKLGKKLIEDKTIIPTEEETYYEFGSFGRDKKGKWRGIARHDDIAMTELNLSRLYKEQEYADWLYDFLEGMKDSPEKKYALEILKEPYDENEISDEMFKALHEEESLNIINEIFNQNNQQINKYKSLNPFTKK